MSIKLEEYLDSQAENAAPRWHTVEVGGGKTFDVELILPTITDRILDNERGRCPIKRISRHVKNWRNVLDKSGEELPFTRNGLIALCEVSPVVLASIVGAIDALYRIDPQAKAEPQAESKPERQADPVLTY